MLSLALAAIIQQAVVFAPPLDRAIAYRFVDERVTGGRTMRFTLDRRVTFRRAGGGLTAEVETIAVDQSAGGAGAMFAGMMRALIGRRIVYHLDTGGTITDIDDLDLHWDAYVRAIEATGASDPARSAGIARVAAAQRAAPRMQRLDTLSTYLAPLLAAQGARQPVDRRAIALPGHAPDGSTVSLSGTEQVTRSADGLLDLVREAAGTIGGTETRSTLRQRIDPTTGIAQETIDRLETVAGDVRSTVTRTTILLSVS